MMETCPHCGEVDDNDPTERCDRSRRPCRHHCDCVWEHDECCWCGREWLGDGVTIMSREKLLALSAAEDADRLPERDRRIALDWVEGLGLKPPGQR